MRISKLAGNALLCGLLALGGMGPLAAPASAVSWNDYRLGEFYPIASASDPAVRAVGRAVVFFGNATGFVISPDGHVLTNYHVAQSFGSGGTVWVEWTGSGYRRTLNLRLVAASASHDVALYKANVSNLPYVKVDPRAARVREDVFIVGHPNTRAQEVSFGEVLATGLNIAGRPSIEYSAQTWWGSSGSPVCDRAGNVIAIHWGWDANGQSNGRLTGVPFNLIVRAVPQIAAVVQQYGAGASAPPATGSGSGASSGSTASGGSTSGGSTTTTPAPGAGGSSRPVGGYAGTPGLGGGTTVGAPGSTGGAFNPGAPATGTGSAGGNTSGPAASQPSSSVATLPVNGSATGNLTRAGELNVWQLTLQARGALTIQLTGPRSADFDLAVWKWDAASGRRANEQVSEGQTSSETITIRDASPGTYTIVVLAYSGTGMYTLASRLDQQTTVGGGAAGGTTPGTASDILRGDGDWKLYSLTADAGAIRVSLDGPDGADFDVYVFRGSQVDASAVVAAGDSTDPDESVAFQAQRGTYSILVRSAGGAGRFALTVTR